MKQNVHGPEKSTSLRSTVQMENFNHISLLAYPTPVTDIIAVLLSMAIYLPYVILQ